VTSTDSKAIEPTAIPAAVSALRAGGVIACPTESVWGLSCDPFNEAAVSKLLALKDRDRQQGLILIAAGFDQIEPLIGNLPPERKAAMLATWPGPVTWVVPAHSSVPSWITGERDTVALRVSSHPVAAALCRAFGCPLVSTSANPSGAAPARSEKEVRALFSQGIDALVPGTTGDAAAPTQIRDALTGKVLRASP
jgi:L-threonylcarbamoyladenylate synthase